MRGVEVRLRVGKVVEAFEFVRNAFDLEMALVPGIEDTTCAPFPDNIVDVMVSSCRADLSWGWGWGWVGWCGWC